MPIQSHDGPPVEACFGDNCVRGHITHEAAPDGFRRTIQVHIAADELRSQVPDLMAPMQLWMDPSLGVHEQQRLRYGGYATRLTLADDGCWQLEADNAAPMKETRLGGIKAKGVPPPDLLYAATRDMGINPDRIRIHAWDPPAERFVVAIPVEGVEAVGELIAGSPDIGITVDTSIPTQLASLADHELHPLFVETGVWAVCSVEGRAMWDAEQAGVRRLERLIGRLALAARYSLAATPTGTLREFRRGRHLTRARLRPIAGVLGLGTGRMWLRGYGHSLDPKEIDRGSLDGLGEIIGKADERVDEAITAWRRAIEARDASLAVVALAEAIEFYAAEMAAPKLFTTAQVKAMKRAVVGVLADELKTAQRERIETRIGQLNEPPLAVRLQAAIEADRVPMTAEDFAVLRRIRELRRKVGHGESREFASIDELGRAIAVVNRLLVYRLARVDDASPSA